MKVLQNTFPNQVKIARQFFIISALYGLTLRLYKVVDFIPASYKSIVQAHSHVTFLGWGFLAVISLIGFVYYPKYLANSRYLKNLFRLMALMLFGMLISFPIQGYKLFSILFLSVFLITSYFYLFAILKQLKSDKKQSTRFIKTGIYYYYLSSLAIWTVAFVTVKFGKIDLYFNAVYFYLHFLYNGFFVFVLFGLWINYIEKKQLQIKENHIKFFYLFTHIACIPAYALSLLWTDVPTITYFIGGIASGLQLISLYYLYPIYISFYKSLQSKRIKWISIVVIISYFLKVSLQFLSSFPSIVEKAVALKSFFIIGYLHLFTLGFMSMFIFLLLSIFPKIKLNKIGLFIFVLGVLLSETILFSNGLLVLFFKNGMIQIDWLLLYSSALMPIGLLILYFTHAKEN